MARRHHRPTGPAQRAGPFLRVDGHPSAGPKAHTLQHNPLGGHIGAIAKGDAKLQRALRGEFLLACAGVYHMALRGQTKKKIQEFFFVCPLPRVRTYCGILRRTPKHANRFISALCSTRGSGQKKKNSWIFFSSCPRSSNSMCGHSVYQTDSSAPF